MAKLYDISQWSEQPWWNTGGTRIKKVYLNPQDGKLYYFKQSYNKGEKNYEYEFWSEIVASEVGIILGFDLLPYHIAKRGSTIGCISESMINSALEELVEGGKYLQAFDNTFEPEDIKKRDQYDFQLILQSFAHFGLDKYIDDIISIILFDAFIGNSDRHQENWAFINTHSTVSRSLSQMARGIKGIEGKENQISSRFWRWVVRNFYMVKGKVRPEFNQVSLMLAKGRKFAPIYDNGCSFGRELKDKKVVSMLGDPTQLVSYLKKGKAEIHWENQKINHFEILEKILVDSGLQPILLKYMKQALDNYDENRIVKLIEEVDNPLKQIDSHSGLPNERKALMIKLLDLRRHKIAELYSQYRK